MLIVISLIGWNFNNFEQTKSSKLFHDSQANYQSSNAIIYIYDLMGKLSYKLKTDETKYFSINKISYFINPILTTYDRKAVPAWLIRANKAKLTNDNILYLYGNVQINNLNSSSDLQQILTENAIIDLITQDVSSNNKVTAIGISLRSVGMKMRGNMRMCIAELIEDVKTYYEIQNNKIDSKRNN